MIIQTFENTKHAHAFFFLLASTCQKQENHVILVSLSYLLHTHLFLLVRHLSSSIPSKSFLSTCVYNLAYKGLYFHHSFIRTNTHIYLPFSNTKTILFVSPASVVRQEKKKRRTRRC